MSFFPNMVKVKLNGATHFLVKCCNIAMEDHVSTNTLRDNSIFEKIVPRRHFLNISLQNIQLQYKFKSIKLVSVYPV